MDLYEFIQEPKSIHQNMRAMTTGIELTYGNTHDERNNVEWEN